jgi:hypothetical protein
MKEFANNFKTQFSQDQKVLSQISQKQDTNIDKTKSEVDKIHKVESSLMPGLFQKVIMVGIALATFVFMFMFIRLFPNKRYLPK